MFVSVLPEFYWWPKVEIYISLSPRYRGSYSHVLEDCERCVDVAICFDVLLIINHCPVVSRDVIDGRLTIFKCLSYEESVDISLVAPFLSLRLKYIIVCVSKTKIK